MRPDKKSVTDEVWDDARVREFLEPPLAGPDAPGFTLLLRAYRSMRPDDFERFARFFAEAGHDFDAKNAQGESFAEFVARHRQARAFVDVIARVRAERSV